MLRSVASKSVSTASINSDDDALVNALPYRSRHAIFVREGAHRVLDAIDLIPDVLRIRPISLRGFSENGEMVDADLVDGDALAPLIERFFKNPAIVYL